MRIPRGQGPIAGRAALAWASLVLCAACTGGDEGAATDPDAGGPDASSDAGMNVGPNVSDAGMNEPDTHVPVPDPDSGLDSGVDSSTDEDDAGTTSCGDGDIGADEDCDGTNFGLASCASLGFDHGSLGCTSGCTIDTSACVACTDVWHLDFDGDGYGDSATSVVACSAPPNYVADSTDCEDGDDTIHPTATEICNGADDDCDLAVDVGAVDASTWYLDFDGDGYGDSATSEVACSAPPNHVADSTDCEDGDDTIHPMAMEVCNGVDDDCNTTVDDVPSGGDADADGFAAGAVDCDDCDPYINRGAFDAVEVDGGGDPLPDGQQIDDDCIGGATLPSDPSTCDDSLAINDADPLNAARAIDLCATTTSGGVRWGVIEAKYTQMDGSPAVVSANFDLGHGILSQFGPNVTTRAGSSLLALSTGAARTPSDPGYVSSLSKGYSSTWPSAMPMESPSCPGILTGTPNDSIGLEITVRVPTNAVALSFDGKFYAKDFPSFVCTQYNDHFFVPLMPGVDNIVFDALGNPLTLNSTEFDVCTSGFAGGKFFACASGTDELVGTGFGIDTEGTNRGGTSWLTSTAPVTPGSTITLRFAVTDAGDDIGDSTALIDNFRWTLAP